MAGKLGKFQMQEFTTVKGMVKQNHIGAMFQKNPQKASNMMVKLLAAHYGKSLETFLSKFPTRYFDTDDEYTWDVIGSYRRNIPLLEARDANGNVIDGTTYTSVGANHEPFYMVFPEDYFAKGEVLLGPLNNVYNVRVISESAKMEGTHAVYKVEVYGSNTAGIPYKYVKAGSRYSVGFAPVSKTLSRKVGDIRHAAPVQMRNEFSTIRIQHKVPGGMENVNLAVGIPVIDKAGNQKVFTAWMQKVDYELEVQFAEYKNKALLYGTSTRYEDGTYSNFDFSGEPLQQGAGLFEQMEVSNTIYYNTFSLKLIEDVLYQLSTAKLGMNERVFMISCGEAGAIQLHKAILNSVSGWTQFAVNADALKIIKRVNSPLHENALSAGFQFVEYMAPNGVTVKIDIDPWKDDPVDNKILLDGKPAMSYRYDIFYVGSGSDANIFKAEIKNMPEMRGYQWGMRNSFTRQYSNNNMSYDEDSTVIHKMAQLGIGILDPTRTVSIIPNVLQA